jgi:predicted TIM-barrel fold metal-dependent hydrolase
MSAAFCNAVNSWVAATYLDHEPRLRASVVISLNNPGLAVKEIELRAADRRFVQVVVLANGDRTLGRREHWPVFEAAEKHQMPIAVHLGSLQRFAPTQSGYPSTYVEDYSGATQGFATGVLSLLAEGVFGKFPNLKFVLSESGVTWLPSLMWRVSKEWRGTRLEIPWVKESPATLVRRNIRMTLQPFDAPPSPNDVGRALDHLGGGEDMILFSTDYPHDHFDGDKALPAGLPADWMQKIVIENPLATYPRLEPA